MKKQTLVLAAISACFFMSCASKEAEDDEIYYEGDEGFLTEIEAPEMNENFLADFDEVLLENSMVLVKNMGKLKPREIKHVYLYPRKNTIEMKFHYGVNMVAIILNQKERTKIIENAERFFAEYEAKELHKHKVKAKTAYCNSTMPFYWGVTSTNNGTVKNKYYLNYEIIDKRAYFVIHFTPTRCDQGYGNGESDVDVYTPKMTLYLSPSQLHDFVDLLDQENLLSVVKGLKKKAYTY